MIFAECRSRPIRHWPIVEALSGDMAAAALAATPPADWFGWVRYDSPWESRKRTCCDLAILPQPIVAAIALLTSAATTQQLRTLTGVVDLIPDPFLHGAGLHVTDPGGELGCHLDGALLPRAPWLERRVNLIIYLNAATGGELQFHDDEGRAVLAKIQPRANAGAVWECSDLAYHSVARLEGKTPRASIAVFYCGPARHGVTRKRALWVPQRS